MPNPMAVAIREFGIVFLSPSPFPYILRRCLRAFLVSQRSIFLNTAVAVVCWLRLFPQAQATDLYRFGREESWQSGSVTCQRECRSTLLRPPLVNVLFLKGD